MINSPWYKYPAWSAILVAGALTGLFFIKGWLWCLALATALLFLALVSNSFVIWFDKYWLRLAHAMGKVSNTVLLTLVFYLLLTPLAGLSRLFGNNDPMKRKKVSSTFKVVEKTFPRGGFEQTW